MPDLAQDILAAWIALAVYAFGALLALGRYRTVALPPSDLPAASNDIRPIMSAPRPATEPLDVSSVSIAVGMGVIAILSGLALLACLSANGWM